MEHIDPCVMCAIYTVCSNQGFIAIQFLELKGIFGDKIWPGCDTKVDFSTLGQTGVLCP